MIEIENRIEKILGRPATSEDIELYKKLLISIGSNSNISNSIPIVNGRVIVDRVNAIFLTLQKRNENTSNS